MREKIALSAALQGDFLDGLVSLSAVNEAAILSTCNRTEIYCHTQDPDVLIPWIAETSQLPHKDIAPYFYTHPGHSAVRHTLRVASGLDSMMLGEPQILGQLKQAYQAACHAGTIQNHLRGVFEYVFSASKRIRTQSGIGNNPVSIAFAAAQLLNQHFSQLAMQRVLLIGSGEMSSLVAKYLHKQGVKDLTIASRTPEKAKALAKLYSAKTLNINDISQSLPQTDIVITATACPLPFISKALIEQAMQQHTSKAMFFIDLAVPRDIEHNVTDIEGVRLYNIDDLKAIIDKGMDERKSAAHHAERLVNDELENYIRWNRSLAAKDLICNYREQMRDLTQSELKRAMQKLNAGQSETHVLNEFSERLLNKLTHQPTVGIRKAAWDNRKDLLDLMQYLFNPSKEAIQDETIS